MLYLPDLDDYFKNYLYKKWQEEIITTTDRFRVMHKNFKIYRNILNGILKLNLAIFLKVGKLL